MPVLLLIIGMLARNRTETSPKTQTGNPRLVRITQRGTLGGICAGFAYKFGMPTWLARVIMVLLVLFSGIGLIAYLLLRMFMPVASHLPEDFDERTERI